MKRKVIVAFVVFTVFVCILYVYNNPIILTHIESETFTQGEVFVPFNGEYDFKTFKLNSSAFNYTVKFA